MSTYTITRTPNTTGPGGALTTTALALVVLIGFVIHAHSRKGGAR